MLLNELLPAPKDAYSAEWVELRNASAATIDLSGWSIDDSVDGGGQPVPEGSTLAPGALLIVELNRAIFNNDGDSVRLLGPHGELIDSFTYLKARPDRSFSRGPAGWADAPPSPGEPNALDEPAVTDPPPAPSDAAGAPAAQRLTSSAPTSQSGPAAISAPVADPSAATEPDKLDAAPLWQIAPALRAGAAPPAPTYALAAPMPLPEPVPSCAPATSCERAASEDERFLATHHGVATAAPARAPIWPTAGGTGLVVVAAALLILGRMPTAPESEEDGVL